MWVYLTIPSPLFVSFPKTDAGMVSVFFLRKVLKVDDAEIRLWAI